MWGVRSSVQTSVGKLWWVQWTAHGKWVVGGHYNMAFIYEYACNIMVNKNSKMFPNQPDFFWVEKPAWEDNLSGSTIYKSVQRPDLLRKIFQQVLGFQRCWASPHWFHLYPLLCCFHKSQQEVTSSLKWWSVLFWAELQPYGIGEETPLFSLHSPKSRLQMVAPSACLWKGTFLWQFLLVCHKRRKIKSFL